MTTAIELTEEAAKEFFTDHNLVKHLSPNIPVVVMKDLGNVFKAFIKHILHVKAIKLHHHFVDGKFNIGLFCESYHNKSYALNIVYDTTKNLQDMVISTVQSIVNDAMLTVPEPYKDGRLSSYTSMVIKGTMNSLFNRQVAPDDIHVSYMGSKTANSGFIASAKSFDSNLDHNNNPFYLVTTLMFDDGVGW
jgi:hypothetical protein